MRYSLQMRGQLQSELRHSHFGRMRMTLQSLAAVAFIALLAAGPIAGQGDGQQPRGSEQAAEAPAQRAVIGVEEHRKAVFDERRLVWRQQQEKKGGMFAKRHAQ